MTPHTRSRSLSLSLSISLSAILYWCCNSLLVLHFPKGYAAFNNIGVPNDMAKFPGFGPCLRSTCCIVCIIFLSPSHHRQVILGLQRVEELMCLDQSTRFVRTGSPCKFTGNDKYRDNLPLTHFRAASGASTKVDVPGFAWARNLPFHDPSHTVVPHRELRMAPPLTFHDPSHTFVPRRELQLRPTRQGSHGPETLFFMTPHTLACPIGSSN